MRAKPITETLHRWLIAQRQRVPEGSGTALAIDYSLKRWEALTRYLDDGDAPIDNNWVENQIRPWAIGRSNWLFAGALRGSQRAAAIMSLIQSARLNGHDPYAYMKDVLTRLPTQKNSQINAKSAASIGGRADSSGPRMPHTMHHHGEHAAPLRRLGARRRPVPSSARGKDATLPATVLARLLLDEKHTGAACVPRTKWLARVPIRITRMSGPRADDLG